MLRASFQPSYKLIIYKLLYDGNFMNFVRIKRKSDKCILIELISSLTDCIKQMSTSLITSKSVIPIGIRIIVETS